LHEEDRIIDLIEKCLEGTASPEEEHYLLSAASTSEKIASAIHKAAEMDALLCSKTNNCTTYPPYP